jgi:hypothetical protein
MDDERDWWTAAEAAAVERLAEALLDGDDGAVRLEVAAARLALARLLRGVADPVKLADGVGKAAMVVFRARQVELATAAAEGRAEASELRALADRILDDLDAERRLTSSEFRVPSSEWGGARDGDA